MLLVEGGGHKLRELQPEAQYSTLCEHINWEFMSLEFIEWKGSTHSIHTYYTQLRGAYAYIVYRLVDR